MPYRRFVSALIHVCPEISVKAEVFAEIPDKLNRNPVGQFPAVIRLICRNLKVSFIQLDIKAKQVCNSKPL